MIWANLLHLSYNFWNDASRGDDVGRPTVAQPYLRCDQSLWDDLLRQSATAGHNMVVIDLGDAIQYQSHPEIAVENAWSPDRLRAELAKIRALGLEPIPKLNFSTAHDVWLGEYGRMVSTRIYYQVVRDLIHEVCALFDTPRFFHLGMDEETASHQRRHSYAVMRQYELWWHDLFLMIGAVESEGVRAWVWSDYMWNHPEEFLRQMPKSVLQSNWYYGEEFTDFGDDAQSRKEVQAYLDLEAHGHDQVPTRSSWYGDKNLGLTARFCREHIAPERLLGLMSAPWHPTLEPWREYHESALRQLTGAMAPL